VQGAAHYATHLWRLLVVGPASKRKHGQRVQVASDPSTNRWLMRRIPTSSTLS